MRPVYHNPADAFAAFIQGEERALLFFFNQLYPALSYFAFSLLHQQQEAEDIAEEAFLKAWDNRNQLQSPNHLRAYLFSLARNACIDSLRHRKTATAIHKRIGAAQDAYAPSIDQQIAREESLAQVYALAQLLPLKCRQVFDLFYKEGLNAKEVAQKLQRSINTVRVQKAKALSIIKSKLPPEQLSLILLLSLPQ